MQISQILSLLLCLINYKSNKACDKVREQSVLMRQIRCNGDFFKYVKLLCDKNGMKNFRFNL